MAEPITRTVIRIVENDNHSLAWFTPDGKGWIPDNDSSAVKQVAVPWCGTHEEAIPPTGECYYRRGLMERGHTFIDPGSCKLLDPHAPDAVWRDTK